MEGIHNNTHRFPACCRLWEICSFHEMAGFKLMIIRPQRYVLSQVIQCGTVELVNMMHYGYPNRLPIKDLVNRYRHMMPKRFHAMDE